VTIVRFLGWMMVCGPRLAYDGAENEEEDRRRDGCRGGSRRRWVVPVRGEVSASSGAIMEPRGPAESLDLGSLRIDILRQAVESYLGLAYPTDPPPEVVRRRLEWPPDADAEALLTHPPFERAGKGGEAGAAPIFALRLGNARYPHMKLQVQP